MQTTVYSHRGLDIQIKLPASSNELGYTINHARFTGCKFNLIQDAIDAIDAINHYQTKGRD